MIRGASHNVCGLVLLVTVKIDASDPMQSLAPFGAFCYEVNGLKGIEDGILHKGFYFGMGLNFSWDKVDSKTEWYIAKVIDREKGIVLIRYPSWPFELLHQRQGIVESSLLEQCLIDGMDNARNKFNDNPNENNPKKFVHVALQFPVPVTADVLKVEGSRGAKDGDNLKLEGFAASRSKFFCAWRLANLAVLPWEIGEKNQKESSIAALMERMRFDDGEDEDS